MLERYGGRFVNGLAWWCGGIGGFFHPWRYGIVEDGSKFSEGALG